MRVERIPLSATDEQVYLDAYVATWPEGFVRKAILIIPGGGYGRVCSDREGEPIAHAFLGRGYNAFVLQYTVARKSPFPCQLIEAARAIKHIKDNADKYGIDKEQLFVIGFSAGGHLAASCGVLWKMDEIYNAVDMPYGYNKPRGVMLMYPVISPRLKRHFPSFCNLLCTDEPTEEQMAATAIDENVDADSVPAFIMHTADDETVDVNNSLRLAAAYSGAGVPFELHVYPHGLHGIALANSITSGGDKRLEDERIAEWVRLACEWADKQ